MRKAVGAFGDDWRLPTILGQSYLNLTEEQRTQLAIIGLTAGVFVAWNIPACRGFASKYLWHDPLASRPVTLLTSIFAHKVSLRTSHSTSAVADLSIPRSPSLTSPSTPSPFGPLDQPAPPTLITTTTFFPALPHATSSSPSSSLVSRAFQPPPRTRADRPCLQLVSSPRSSRMYTRSESSHLGSAKPPHPSAPLATPSFLPSAAVVSSRLSSQLTSAAADTPYDRCYLRVPDRHRSRLPGSNRLPHLRALHPHPHRFALSLLAGQEGSS